MITTSFVRRPSIRIGALPGEVSVHIVYTCEDCGWSKESRVHDRCADGQVVCTVSHSTQDVEMHDCVQAMMARDARNQAAADLRNLQRIVKDARVWSPPKAKAGDYAAFLDREGALITARISLVRDDGTFTIETASMEVHERPVPEDLRESMERSP